MERTSEALLDKVFPDLGKVAGVAARAGFSAVVRVKEMDRDVFGTGRIIDEDMAGA